MDCSLSVKYPYAFWAKSDFKGKYLRYGTITAQGLVLSCIPSLSEFLPILENLVALSFCGLSTPLSGILDLGELQWKYIHTYAEMSIFKGKITIQYFGSCLGTDAIGLHKLSLIWADHERIWGAGTPQFICGVWRSESPIREHWLDGPFPVLLWGVLTMYFTHLQLKLVTSLRIAI